MRSAAAGVTSSAAGGRRRRGVSEVELRVVCGAVGSAAAFGGCEESVRWSCRWY